MCTFIIILLYKLLQNTLQKRSEIQLQIKNISEEEACINARQQYILQKKAEIQLQIKKISEEEARINAPIIDREAETPKLLESARLELEHLEEIIKILQSHKQQ